MPGVEVTVTGSGFTGATDITFGPQSVPPDNLTDSDFTVTAPDGEATVDIIVTTAAGASVTSAVDQFSYLAIPMITAVEPSEGVAGDTVTVKGNGFSDLTDLTFGSASVEPTNVSDTQITLAVPAGEGTVDVTVTTPAGTSAVTDADQFTYTG